MARTSKKNNKYILQPDSPHAVDSVIIFQTAIYCRLSSAEDTDSDTLEVQIQYLKNYVSAHPEFKLYGVFADNGWSGSNYERPEFLRMMQLAYTGEINCIITKDLSRLGRNYLETGILLEKISPTLNLRFIAVNDNYDTAAVSENAGLLMPIKNILNEMYLRDISQKICSALQEKMARGDYIGNYAPYGYLKDPANRNRLIPDPYTAPTVKRIFQMRADGHSISGIAAQLNREGIYSPGRYRYERGIITNNNKKGAGLLWNRHVLSDLLKNVVYIGHLEQGKARSSPYRQPLTEGSFKAQTVTATNTHIPIIEQELFRRVQQINASHAAVQKKNYGKYSYLPKAVNPYKKKLVCAECGAVIKLVRSFSKKGDKAYFTFKCPSYIEHGLQGCCNKSISQAELNEAVLASLQSHLALFAKCQELRQNQAFQDRPAAREDRALALEEEIRQQEALQTSLYLDMKEGLLTQKEYFDAKQAYADRIVKLTAELKQMKTGAAAACPNLKQLSKQYPSITEINQEVIDAFIEKIQLHADKTLEVHFKYMDEFQALAEEQKRKESDAE